MSRQASLYEKLQQRPGLLHLTEINPVLAGKFMACIDRIVGMAEKKQVPIGQVTVTGPSWDAESESIGFKVKYGVKDL